MTPAATTAAAASAARFPLGLALLTVQREARRDFAGTLARLAAMGYRELDMYPTDAGVDAPAARQALDAAGLTCVSSRVPVAVLSRGWERALDAAATLGARFVTLANVPPEERPTPGDWDELAELFARRGREARARGLTFCYHHHAFEFVPAGGRTPFERLLAATAPDEVRLQVDVYWLRAAGRDPAAELRRLGNRVATLHLKDATPAPASAITTVGRGTLDFRAVLDAAWAGGVRHAFVEEDAPADPLGSARDAAAYLTALGG